MPGTKKVFYMLSVTRHFRAVLCVTTLGFSTPAFAAGLFDNSNAPAITPIQRGILPSLEAPARAPLRVVIPNIKPEAKAKKAAPVAKKDDAELPELVAPAIAAPTSNAAAEVIAAPVVLVPAQTASAPVAEVIYNGVRIPNGAASQVATAPIAAPIILPAASASLPALLQTATAANAVGVNPISEMFSALPVEWVIAQVRNVTGTISELEPAAGGNSAPYLPPAPVPTLQPNGVMVGISPQQVFTPTPGITAPAPTFAQAPTYQPTPITPTESVSNLSSEPAPTLSAKSKAVLEKLPPIDKKPNNNFGNEVQLQRERQIPDFSGDVQVNKEGSKGVSVATGRRMLDSNYELEKAYNALIAGNSDIAIEVYQDILTNDPKNKEALFGLASTYHRVGQIDLARSLYARLLQIDPRHRDGLNNFLVLLGEEAPEEALQQMQRLEAENPSFSPIPAQMAIIHKKLGHEQKAIDKMYHALALSPENVTYRYNLAIMLDKAGEREKAATLYQQVLSSWEKGEVIPGDAQKIQQRLTFIRSNTTR